MIPIRVQRKRIKGWKMPPNTVYVGRPTKWGNPFIPYSYCDMCDGCGWYEGGKTLQTNCEFCDGTGSGIIQAIKKYEHYINTRIKIKDIDISELKGKNISCWCKESEPCHADVLMKIANT